LVAVRMIDDDRGDNGFIGYDDLGSVAVAHDHVTRGHLGELSGIFVDGDEIAYRDRTIEQYDEAANVVASDFQQPETDADADRAPEHGQSGEIDAYHWQYNQDDDQRQDRADQLRQHHAQIDVEAGRHHTAFDDVANPEREQQRYEQRQAA